MRWGFLVIVLSTLGACRSGYIDIYECPHPCYGCDDPCDPCPDGHCVPLPVLGWDGPLLLWMGPEDEAPECPEEASAKVYEGNFGFSMQLDCPDCVCAPPVCRLPGGAVASDIATCPNDEPAATLTPFPAPPGWTGACTVPPAIPDATAASVTFLLPEMSPCEPVTLPEPMGGSGAWKEVVRACRPVEPFIACKEPGLACAPRIQGFRHCVYKEGENLLCPVGYPERRVFYGGVGGSLDCTPCTCGPPEGGLCRAEVRVYEDEACSSLLEAGWVEHDAPADFCSPGLAAGELRGMAAIWETNEPGQCTPDGGHAQGGFEPVEPSTFCCEP